MNFWLFLGGDPVPIEEQPKQALCPPSVAYLTSVLGPRNLTTVALVTVGWLSDEGLAGNTYPTYPRALRSYGLRKARTFQLPRDR